MSGNGDGEGKDSLDVKSPQLIASESPPQPAPAPAPLKGPAAKVVDTMNSVRKVVAVIGIIIAGGTFLVRTRVFGKGLGQGVFSAEECRSGKMMKSEGPLSVGGVCTKDCADDKECGSGLHCVQSSCLPIGTGTLGQRCGALWDCQSQLCVSATSILPAYMFRGTPEAGQPNFTCSQHCDDLDNPCPSGFSCIGGASGNEHFCVDAKLEQQSADSLIDLLRRGQAK